MLTTLLLSLGLSSVLPSTQLALDGLETPTPQQLSAPQRRWYRSASSNSAPFALGQHGTLAWMVANGSLPELLSAFDTHPPTPVWASDPAWILQPMNAAAEADLLLMGHAEIIQGSSLGTTVRAYTSSSTTPLWEQVFEPQFFAVPFADCSRDGQVVVSLLDADMDGQREIRRHDPATGAVLSLQTMPVDTWTARFDLAPDGNVYAHSGYNGLGDTTLRGVASGAVLLQTPGSLPEEQALSHDGRVVILRERISTDPYQWTVRVMVQSAGVWTTVVEDTQPLEVQPTDMAVSHDGSLAAASWWDPADPYQVLVRAWDVASGELVFERTPGSGVTPGLGVLQNYPADLALSDDGSRLALGSWGAGALGPAELIVWDVDDQAQLATFPLAGSVMALDMSPDGERLLVLRLGTHNHQGSSVRLVELYEVGGADLLADGPPVLGGQTTLTLHGAPLQPAWLLVSPALLPTPVQAGLAGLLQLDPNGLLLVPAGLADGDGRAQMVLDVPLEPILVGLALQTQGASGAPLQLGANTLALTVLP